jgi:hypothetical protein
MIPSFVLFPIQSLTFVSTPLEIFCSAVLTECCSVDLQISADRQIQLELME